MKRKIFEQTQIPDLPPEAQGFFSRINPYEEQDNLIRVSDLWEKIKGWKIRMKKSDGTYIDDLENFKKTYFYDQVNLKALYSFLKKLEQKYKGKYNFDIGNSETNFIWKHRLSAPKSVFVGTYKDNDSPKKFFISERRNKLFLDDVTGKIELKKDSETAFDEVYTGKNAYNKEVTITFRSVSGGQIAIFEFTEGSSEYKYTTKKISDQAEPNKDEVDDDEWKCINQFLKDNNHILLLKSAKGDFMYQIGTGQKVEDRDIELVYYKDDNKLIGRFRDNNQPVPDWEGKWECGDDEKSYKLIWKNGTVIECKGSKCKQISGAQTTQTSTSTSTTTPPPQSLFVQACGSSIKNCPKIEDVLANKATFKICMKCPDIKKIQENPRFKNLYMIRLESLNLPQVTDEYFGPAMKLAIEDFQSAYQLARTGSVGKYTWEYLFNPKGPTFKPTNED